MKSVLISTRPQWVEKIASGQKTIEVRKTAPKEVPFKCYIYETKGKKIECGFHLEDTGITLREKFVFGMHKARVVKHYRNEGKGKVIGEFVCDKVDKYTFSHYEAEYRVTHVEQNAMCFNQPELIHYGKGEMLYGLHISDLKIYDKPKELSEFSRPCSYSGLCFSCKRTSFKKDGNLLCNTKITRPPQSWMYVEDLGEEE